LFFVFAFILQPCETTCCGNTIKPRDTKGIWGNPFLAWRNEPGYGHKSLDDDLVNEI
jgi:hypothetical protein